MQNLQEVIDCCLDDDVIRRTITDQTYKDNDKFIQCVIEYIDLEKVMDYYDKWKEKDTIYHAASRYGSIKIITLLLEKKKFNINALNGVKQNCFMLAIKNEKKDIAKLFLNHNISMFIIDTHGKSALTYLNNLNDNELTSRVRKYIINKYFVKCANNNSDISKTATNSEIFMPIISAVYSLFKTATYAKVCDFLGRLLKLKMSDDLIKYIIFQTILGISKDTNFMKEFEKAYVGGTMISDSDPVGYINEKVQIAYLNKVNIDVDFLLKSKLVDDIPLQGNVSLYVFLEFYINRYYGTLTLSGGTFDNNYYQKYQKYKRKYMMLKN